MLSLPMSASATEKPSLSKTSRCASSVARFSRWSVRTAGGKAPSCDWFSACWSRNRGVSPCWGKSRRRRPGGSAMFRNSPFSNATCRSAYASWSCRGGWGNARGGAVWSARISALPRLRWGIPASPTLPTVRSAVCRVGNCSVHCWHGRWRPSPSCWFSTSPQQAWIPVPSRTCSPAWRTCARG